MTEAKKLKITKQMILAMCKVVLHEAALKPIHKEKILIVDDELYGRVDFPISFSLCRGQLIRLPGYGQLQILEATIDTLKCTRSVDNTLCEEYENARSLRQLTADPVPERIPPYITAPAGLLPGTCDGTLRSINAHFPDVAEDSSAYNATSGN